MRLFLLSAALLAALPAARAGVTFRAPITPACDQIFGVDPVASSMDSAVSNGGAGLSLWGQCTTTVLAATDDAGFQMYWMGVAAPGSAFDAGSITPLVWDFTFSGGSGEGWWELLFVAHRPGTDVSDTSRVDGVMPAGGGAITGVQDLAWSRTTPVDRWGIFLFVSVPAGEGEVLRLDATRITYNNPVPEPSTLLLALAAVPLVFRRARR